MALNDWSPTVDVDGDGDGDVVVGESPTPLRGWFL